MKFLMKATVFCAVCLLTWAATHSIMAQQRVRPRASAAQVITTGRDVKTLSEGQINATSTRIPVGQPGMVAEAHVRNGGIFIEDGVATAMAHVSLSDTRGGMSFVWRFQVVGKDGKKLAGQVYDQQIFTLEANGQREVDFSDFVAFPPDADRVELVLYRLNPGEDLSVIDDKDQARYHQVVRLVKLPKN
jgi:hypothetical protein